MIKDVKTWIERIVYVDIANWNSRMVVQNKELSLISRHFFCDLFQQSTSFSYSPSFPWIYCSFLRSLYWFKRDSLTLRLFVTFGSMIYSYITSSCITEIENDIIEKTMRWQIYIFSTHMQPSRVMGRLLSLVILQAKRFIEIGYKSSNISSLNVSDS